MLEIQITMPDLSKALELLAAAIAGRTSVLMQSAAAATTPDSPPVYTNIPDPAPAGITSPVAEPPTTPAASAPVPTSAPQYTLDMLAAAGAALIDGGKMEQLIQILSKFGVASLTDLKPEQYGVMANELRTLGAKI